MARRLEGVLGDADAAELRLIDEMRRIGRASLSAWAQRKAERETASWQPYQENQRIEDDQAPVRVCHRHLSGRLDRLHYDDALRQDLPIGSGEIESAHRYLVQQRLKSNGAIRHTSP